MEVKGTAFLVRAQHIAKAFGEAAWEGFLADYAKKVRSSATPSSHLDGAGRVRSSPTTMRSPTAFSAATRGLLADGRGGGRWGSRGPYAIFARKNLNAFVEKSLPSSGRPTSTRKSRRTSRATLDVTVEDLPVAHVYSSTW
jgi:hypothetical protein